MRLRNGLTVHVLRRIPGELVDGYETEETWSDPEPVTHCAIAPGDVVEPFEPNRDGSSVQYTVYAPAGTQVGKDDRILIPGESVPLDAIGPGREWVSPFTGRRFGVVIKVGRFDG
mgnify:FL=1